MVFIVASLLTTYFNLSVAKIHFTIIAVKYFIEVIAEQILIQIHSRSLEDHCYLGLNDFIIIQVALSYLRKMIDHYSLCHPNRMI